MGVTLVGALAGCGALPGDGDSARPVDVLLQNDDTEAWPLTVAVETESGGERFRTEETIPADTGEDLGEVLIEDAFEGAAGDQFAVQVWLDGEPAGTFEYEITCPDDNRISLLVEHEPYTPDDGEPVDYVPDRCGE
jgi:hypothetical protein